MKIKCRREFPISGFHEEVLLDESIVIEELGSTLSKSTIEVVIKNDRIDLVPEKDHNSTPLWSYIFENGDDFGKFLKKYTRTLLGYPEGAWGPYIPCGIIKRRDGVVGFM